MDNTCCAAWAPRLTSLIRIGSGYMLMLHGSAKLLGIPHAPMFDGLQLFSLYGIAGLIELIAGVLLLIGLFTRPVAFIASGFGAAAYLIGHVATKGFFFIPMFNGGEAALLFSFVFFLLFLHGPGPWSIDAMRGKKD
ncbi:DoxX family protein [Castellaniella sp. GW247-6E4]|uniref:DoxX family protein n=1 Tax=Castellaniella sp. GW247-6E4 TaxID=3140380 RepID=UPI0033158638